jgi:uncharacterized repeat protein (TIGR03803 family)
MDLGSCLRRNHIQRKHEPGSLAALGMTRLVSELRFRDCGKPVVSGFRGIMSACAVSVAPLEFLPQEFAMSRTKTLLSLKVLAVFTFVIALAAGAFGQHLRILNTFTGPNGSQPFGPLVADAKGNLYGATVFGGAGNANAGVVFKLTRSGGGWVETVLHSFTGGDDGGGPVPPLAVDSHGNVFGAASFGGVGTNGGAIFELSPTASGWTETVLYSFVPGSGSAAPGPVVLDAAGNLWGTAGIATGGLGGVFELSPASGGGWNYSLVHTFTGSAHDGSFPYGSLLVSKHGVIYGVTEQGGSADKGTVFALTPSATGWNESVIYSFQGGSDGEDPFGGVTQLASGQLVGTTLLGGIYSMGTIFELTPGNGQWSRFILYNFASFTGDAINPAGPLSLDRSGNLFGATQFGGAYNRGAVFELLPNAGGWAEKVVYSFNVPANLNGFTAVLPDRFDNLYGVGPGGARDGIVFEIVP